MTEHKGVLNAQFKIIGNRRTKVIKQISLFLFINVMYYIMYSFKRNTLRPYQFLYLFIDGSLLSRLPLIRHLPFEGGNLGL